MHNKIRIAVTAAVACSMTLMHQNLRAQSAEQTEESKTEEAPLATVTVTGSLLPTTPDQAAVPIVTLDAKQLEQNGVASNPLEILRKSIPAFEGRGNAGTSNANNDNQRTAGGSQLQLRNLPTLVLINGRRVANSAIGGLTGKNFVDVNQIPAADIDRIEVLTDGASSIYGSDAIGGVVNFISRWQSATNTTATRAARRYRNTAFAGDRLISSSPCEATIRSHSVRLRFTRNTGPRTRGRSPPRSSRAFLGPTIRE
jgi:outer membrane receptor for ferrienterochelin and colicin